MALTSAAFRRLTREITQLVQQPPDGIRICMSEDDVLDFTGWVEGPVGTPYESGYFAIKVMPTHEFPSAPPKCWFQTKIFHPNVNESTGEICVSTLKKDWLPEYGVGHILQTVKCLLIAPNPESALNEEAGKMLLERYEDYTRHARLMTSIHATRQPLDLAKPFTSSVAPIASTSRLPASDEQKSRSRSPSAVRGLSPEIAFPTMPLQASHSTNNINAEESQNSKEGGAGSPGNSKKRTLSSAIGKPAVASTSEAPEPKKPAMVNASNKKRGLKRL